MEPSFEGQVTRGGPDGQASLAAQCIERGIDAVGAVQAVIGGRSHRVRPVIDIQEYGVKAVG